MGSLNIGRGDWVQWRDGEDDRLYELYGRPLEAEHTGELVAIGPDGAYMLGNDEIVLARQALARFGSGNFALRRVGRDFDLSWR